jgi:4'-phosphopantetheinyl transferase
VLVRPTAFSQIWAAVAPHLQRLEQRPGQQQIQASGLYLWLLPLASLPVDASWLDLLSAEEQVRAQAYASALLRRDFIARRVVLRLLLAQVLGQAAAEIIFFANANGQLYLEQSNWHFSLSYSGGMVLYGLAQRPLGVDIEAIRIPKALKRISERYFPGESIDGDADFFAAWTRFEARAKAAGQGIAAYTAHPGQSQHWPCQNIDTLAGFAAAVCWRP